MNKNTVITKGAKFVEFENTKIILGHTIVCKVLVRLKSDELIPYIITINTEVMVKCP